VWLVEHASALGLVGVLAVDEQARVNRRSSALFLLPCRPVDPTGSACQWLSRVLGLDVNTVFDVVL
jgi:hypothetical protein